jgi:hypothetical protein
MICKNCGANITKKENYCPSCGMELMIPYSKSLKEKYIAGEYHDQQDDFNTRGTRSNRSVEREDYPEQDADEYEQYHGAEGEYENENRGSGSSVLLVIILFLIVALLIGFVIGMIIFSGVLQSLPGFSNVTGF